MAHRGSILYAYAMQHGFSLHDTAETIAFGVQLHELLRPGDVLALHGGLGVGKTTLTRGLVRALTSVEEEVPSPTYTLVQSYETANFPLWHYDLYRLESPSDLHELGWDDTSEGVIVVEWPEKAGPLLPAWRLDVFLTFEGDQRLVRLEPRGEDWQTRLHDFRFPAP